MSEIIAVFASARRNGNTGNLINWIADKLKIEVIDLAEKKLSPYDYEHKNIDDDFVPLVNKLLDYEVIIFATPIYWYAPSAQMKTFIDRMSDFLDIERLKAKGRKFRDKKAYIVCTSISDEADSSFINALKDTFEYLGMSYGGYIHANCCDGYHQNKYLEDVDKFIQSVKNPTV